MRLGVHHGPIKIEPGFSTKFAELKKGRGVPVVTTKIPTAATGAVLPVRPSDGVPTLGITK